ncbi:MAG: cell division protein ZapB [Treponema sp.]|nr:cell division protein ZapB [Treponema sp.]
MLSLEQVKLLESKVSRTIDYVKKVNGENTALKERLDSCQKRIDELEALVKKFKDEQGRIEEGILSALDRLNQFEDALDLKSPNEGKLSSEDKPEAPKEEDSENGELDIF